MAVVGKYDIGSEITIDLVNLLFNEVFRESTTSVMEVAYFRSG